jgi:HAD superfamily hydrolase (TIGR01484 family)
VRFHALVTDYDGTLAHDGRVSSETISSLERLRASGRRLVLVTGRELDDLRHTFDRLDVFDVVVAENGALVFDPSTREERLLCEPPPDHFVRALKDRGVSPLSVGRAIVATQEPNETVVLEVIKELGLELEIIFNKGAVMVLPSGVNKATGLVEALGRLGLSAHNAVAVGDAENDHAFLSSCEASVAVANALPTLKERADFVTKGKRGDGVVELVEALLRDDLASLDERLVRHRLRIGTTPDGEPVAIAPFDRRILLSGPSGAGKSTLTTTFLEELGVHEYQFCLIDPEGDHMEFPGAVTLGDPDGTPTTAEVLEVLADARASAVVDLVGLPLSERPEFFAELLPRLQELQTRFGRPHWIIVDEAHHLMPTSWNPTPSPLPPALGSALLVVLDPARLSRAALATITDVIAVGDEPWAAFEPFAGATHRRPPPGRVRKPADASGIVWHADGGAAASRGADAAVVPIKVRPPRFHLERHRRKYAEGELPANRSFYFRGPDGRLNLRAQNLVVFSQIAEGVDDETWLHHLRRRDYSKWMREMIKDDDLADAVAAIEGDEGLNPDDSRRRVREAVEERYASVG